VRRLSRSPRDPTFVADPYPFYAEARAAGPLFLWEEYDHPCAAGWDAVNALLRDRRFGREPLGGFGPRPARMADFYAIDDRSMLEREPPDHTRLRGLVLRAITSRRIAALGPGIAALASSLADALPEPEADLLPAFARPLPVVVIARLLGVPEDRSDDLLAWSNAMVAVYQARRDSAVEARANEAARDFTAFLRAASAARRRAPRDDPLTALVAAEAEAERLDEAELVATATLLLNAGHEATVNALANGVALILGRGPTPRLYSRTRPPPPRPSRSSCASTRRCTSSPAMPARTPRPSATASAAARSWACCSPLRTATRRASPIRTASTPPASAASGAKGTPPSAPASTSASARRLRASSSRWGSARSSVAGWALALAEPPRFADRYHFRSLERLAVRP
jgi:hypothetical protein